MPIISSSPIVHCSTLSTTFVGVDVHPDLPIHQFRGIKYASIPARFRRSRLQSLYPSITDATLHGPICPQPKQRSYLFELALEHDEFECLNLAITVPGGAPSSGARLPVMVWIHGGNNVQGFGTTATTDPSRLVAKSMELERPVMVVAINYRLGLFGFAASPALEKDNHSYGETGVGNYGLYDQINALKWIQNHIPSFGGDPSQLTLFGEASGAINIHALLLSASHQTRPLASRAIMQNGVLNPALVPSAVSQGTLLSSIMAHLHLGTVQDLRRIPADMLVPYTPCGGMFVTNDGCFFRTDWQTWPYPRGLAGGFIIGDSAAPLGSPSPSFAAASAAGAWTTRQIIRRVRAIVRSVYKADALLRAYGVEWTTPDEEAVWAVWEMVTDAEVVWPVDALVRRGGAPGTTTTVAAAPAYRYLFNQDVCAEDSVYLFDNVPVDALYRHVQYTHHRHYRGRINAEDNGSENEDEDAEEGTTSTNDGDLDSEDGSDDEISCSDAAYNLARVRHAMQERWIAFANGEKPWCPTAGDEARDGSGGGNVYVFGPEGEAGERGGLAGKQVIQERRRHLGEWSSGLAEEALVGVPHELVLKVAAELKAGPSAVRTSRGGLRARI